jgi:hypothetical protein
MLAPRSVNAFLGLLVALGLLLAPMSARAGGARPTAKPAAAPARDRSAAARKGVETKNQKKKAEANWATRVSKNPALAKDSTAKATFVARSVSSQKAAAQRRAAKPVARKTVKQSKKKVARARPAKVASAKGPGKKAKGAKRETLYAPGSESITIDEFDPASMDAAIEAFERSDQALDQEDNEAALEAAIEGHEIFAYEAHAAADRYEDAGDLEKADELRTYADEAEGRATSLTARLDAERGQARPAGSFIDRFKSTLAAKRAFKNIVNQDEGVRQAYNGRRRGTFMNGILTGAGGLLTAAGLIGATGLVGLVAGAVGLAAGGVREYRSRDAAQKATVRELHDQKLLEAEEVAVFEKAGWL